MKDETGWKETGEKKKKNRGEIDETEVETEREERQREISRLWKEVWEK